MSESRPAASTSLLKRHIYCVGCQYDLFGQSIIGHCPECGLAVQRSRVRLPLDSDLHWQLQIEKGMLLAIFASAGWALCLALAITTWFVPGAGAFLLIATVATAIVEPLSRRLLWNTPSGCEPLLSRGVVRVAIVFDLLETIGLLAIGVGGALWGTSYHETAWMIVMAASVPLLLGVAHLLPLYGLYAAIAEAIGSERLPRDLQWLATVRVSVEFLLFGLMVFASYHSYTSNMLSDDGPVTMTWLAVIAYCFTQAFTIGSTYDLWRRVQQVRELEEGEYRDEFR